MRCLPREEQINFCMFKAESEGLREVWTSKGSLLDVERASACGGGGDAEWRWTGWNCACPRGSSQLIACMSKSAKF